MKLNILKNADSSQQSKVLVSAGFLLLIIIVWQAFSYVNNQQTLAYQHISTPKLNDVYVINSEVLNNQSRLREKYLITQVSAVEDDKVSLRVSNFLFLRVRDAIQSIRSDKFLTQNYFSATPLVMPRTRLQQLYLDDGIDDVGRSTDGMHLYGGVIIGKAVKKKRTVRLGSQDNQVAIAYYQGSMGYEKDWREAFRLFKQAAEKGHPYAQLNLANMYKDGEGVAKDLQLAIFWYEKASLQQVTAAKYEYLRLCQQLVECTELP
ncbi:tetratricopeptide repeat protein [Thalassotalea sp. ND16A]|uniref:tetratricopeptide repeat protein n=1 Tax=Thalassotalea sp. ND16A TaxID=1535422 RepID=UPI000519FC55|nr:tetratricopeptide repeat protein [Thalassotalea sp. ND16A]KGK00414.1 hypothetical protein ND16A_3491 [Thalassotalea sp. ND16A]